MEHPSWAVLAAVILVVACNRHFFPTRYEIDAEGITARFPLKTVRHSWSELRRFVFNKTGGFLSPRAKPSIQDEYRGISLLFPPDAQTVIQEIALRLPGEAIVRNLDAKNSAKETTACGG